MAVQLGVPLQSMLQEDPMVRDYCDYVVEKLEFVGPDVQWLNGLRREAGQPGK